MDSIVLRSAAAGDRPFLVEMARQVCTLPGRPLAAADDPHVVAFLPDPLDGVVVAVDRGISVSVRPGGCCAIRP
jgi:hypothetical protein